MSEPSGFGKYYLLCYNIVQTLGWFYLLWQSLEHFLNRGTLDTYWAVIKWTVIIFQNAAVLEILHAALKLVPSSVFVVLMQVYSRVFLVCGALMATNGATTSPGLPLCILAWSITEIIRYAYYALNLINVVPQSLIFLRYSTFLVLYPLGITGELLCMYHSLDEIAEKKLNKKNEAYHLLIEKLKEVDPSTNSDMVTKKNNSLRNDEETVRNPISNIMDSLEYEDNTDTASNTRLSETGSNASPLINSPLECQPSSQASASDSNDCGGMNVAESEEENWTTQYRL
ncbi:unnamed protein product [Parnassius apollo]|uniref:Very-long-chain (3R)-3-hydroxyacyl-CoA dehydratase n=1 Tax=Parnassius apollo TaxID=110799 RepID=A0A8S3XEE1_PARAO|nr:unnamed protein product [Parnassius apollo]